MVDESSRDIESIVDMVIQKGFDNVDLSMFSDEEKEKILQEVAENYLRQGKKGKVLKLLDKTDLDDFDHVMRPVAEEAVEMEEYGRAVKIYRKIGYHELADFIEENFVKKYDE